MVWNGSQLRGFCANMQSHCIDALNGMDDVAIVEKSQTISLSRTQTTRQATWGLDRISTAEAITGSPTGLNYTYSYDAATTKALPGAGADIYLIDTGINTEHVSFGGRAKMIWPNSTGDDMGYVFHPTLLAQFILPNSPSIWIIFWQDSSSKLPEIDPYRSRLTTCISDSECDALYQNRTVSPSAL